MKERVDGEEIRARFDRSDSRKSSAALRNITFQKAEDEPLSFDEEGNIIIREEDLCDEEGFGGGFEKIKRRK